MTKFKSNSEFSGNVKTMIDELTLISNSCIYDCLIYRMAARSANSNTQHRAYHTPRKSNFSKNLKHKSCT